VTGTDFSLILATIITSFSNFMKLSADPNLDMASVQGSGDAYEEAKTGIEDGEDKTQATGSSNVAQAGKENGVGVGGAKKSGPKAVAAAWDDDDDSSEDDTPGETESESSVPTWSADDDFGLENVLLAFQMLSTEFNEKFRKIFA